MIRLIQNECIKIFRQTGYKVLMIILLVVAVLIPTVHFGFSLLIDLVDNAWSVEDTCEEYEEMVEELKNEEDPSSRIEAAIYTAWASTGRFFLEHEIDESWKYGMYSYKLENEMELLQLYRLLESGEVDFEDVDLYGYGWSIRNALSDPISEEDSDVNVTEKDPLEKDMSTVNWGEEAAKQEAKVTEMKEMILSATAESILKGELEQVQQELLLAEEELVLQEALLKENASLKDGDEKEALYYAEIEYQRDLAKAMIECAEERIWAYTFLYENLHDPDTWQYRLVHGEFGYMLEQYYTNTVPYPELLWEEHYASFYEDSYEEYLEDMEKDSFLIAGRDTLAAARYALERDLAPPTYADTSTKSYMHTYLYLFMSMLSIFVIVLMGMIVASEYSSGTIRLLVIRPRNRHKILTSKLLSALLYCLGLTVTGTLVMAFLCTLFFGFGDSFVSDIYVVGGNAFAIPAILTFIAELLLTLLGILLRAAIALFFSAVTKKAALAIVIPMILNTYTFSIQMVSVMLTEIFPFIRFTVLPYLAPEILLARPLDSAGISFLFMGGSYGIVESLGAVYGIVLMILHVFAVVLGTYLIFNRQQIKS